MSTGKILSRSMSLAKIQDDREAVSGHRHHLGHIGRRDVGAVSFAAGLSECLVSHFGRYFWEMGAGRAYPAGVLLCVDHDAWHDPDLFRAHGRIERDFRESADSA